MMTQSRRPWIVALAAIALTLPSLRVRWLANRNAVLAAFFGVLAMIAHAATVLIASAKSSCFS